MPYIKKEKIRVVVYTGRYRIIGNIYYVPGTRLTDTLNVKVKDFIPLTEVVVMDDRENAVLVEVPYLAVYRDSIIFVYPLEPEKQFMLSEEEEKSMKKDLNE
jgi:hypothetical protein